MEITLSGGMFLSIIVVRSLHFIFAGRLKSKRNFHDRFAHWRAPQEPAHRRPSRDRRCESRIRAHVKARADFLATKRERVAASNTVLEAANGGFQVLFLDQNYDWAVSS